MADIADNRRHMEPNLEYRFIINAYTPATLPMSRLAEYLSDLAKLLGSKDGIHFLHLEPGSSVVAYKVDPDAAIAVTDRLAKTRAGDGPQDALQAVHSINKLLIEDRTDGYIRAIGGAEIIDFPGYRLADIKNVIVRSPLQPDSLDGVVQRVGKLGQNASILLEGSDGRIFACKTFKSTAKKLALHIFGDEVRLHGFAKWHRTISGQWALDEFFIHDFEVLLDKNLSNVVAELHAVNGSDWVNIKDPWLELEQLRGNEAGDEL